MVAAWIGLGGNVGDVEATFAAALDRLDADSRIAVTARSTVHGTAPIGAQAGNRFRNMAAALETTRSPHELLDRLQEVERDLGRTRELHWGPRTLDVDLLLFGESTIDDDRLVVPHPAMWYRRFVLDPLAEIAGDVVHPIKGLTIRELRRRLLARPLQVALAGGEAARRRALADSIAARLDPARAAAVVLSTGAGGADESSAATAMLLPWIGPGPASERLAALPPVPRIDVSSIDDGQLVEFLTDVIESALG